MGALFHFEGWLTFSGPSLFAGITAVASLVTAIAALRRTKRVNSRVDQIHGEEE
jgi:hypothetical protein